jgi:mRNA interferase RelE/StbE
MNPFEIMFDRRVLKDLAHLPNELQNRILEHLEVLTQDPFAHGTIKLKGETAYRVRVGDYRIVFDVDTGVRMITVLAVDHRSSIYKR